MLYFYPHHVPVTVKYSDRHIADHGADIRSIPIPENHEKLNYGAERMKHLSSTKSDFRQRIAYSLRRELDKKEIQAHGKDINHRRRSTQLGTAF